MSLHHTALGAGRDLVLIHGWGTHGRVWSELADDLAQHFRVHVVDLPGCGESADCDPYSVDHVAAALARDMPPRCGVVGWSLGGQIALAWARKAPRQIERIALIATSPCFARRRDWPHAVSGELLQEFGRALTADALGTLRRFFSLQALGDERTRDVVARLRACLKQGGAPSPAALAGGLNILLEADQRAELAAISQPVLVLHGERDRVAPLGAGEHLSRSLPNAELIVIPGAAHAPFVTALPEVSAHLTRFFQ
jgi:pimeloyl-[acyl-carrier protein] methyl ester esterase